MSYQQKYLKYKKKYLDAKNKIGGSNPKIYTVYAKGDDQE